MGGGVDKLDNLQKYYYAGFGIVCLDIPIQLTGSLYNLIYNIWRKYLEGIE